MMSIRVEGIHVIGLYWRTKKGDCGDTLNSSTRTRAHETTYTGCIDCQNLVSRDEMIRLRWVSTAHLPYVAIVKHETVSYDADLPLQG